MKIGIAGLGLIGGSLGLALQGRGHEVVGWDADASVRDHAFAQGLCASLVHEPERLGIGAQLLVLCVPVGALASAAAAVRPGLGREVVVTDVGSVKGDVIPAVQAALGEEVRFVPGHPMAGRERSGPSAANANLFAGATVVLCPSNHPEATQRVQHMWAEVDAHTISMEPDAHDRAVSFVSHVPHVVSFALAAMVGAEEERNPGTLSLSAGGLHDLTRVAGSHPQMWADILLHNSEQVLQGLEQFESSLGRLRELVRAGDATELKLWLSMARKVRQAIEDPERFNT